MAKLVDMSGWSDG